ncbi:hypothetical protein NEFER03_1685 [Nematocida sp. LUAm3]|nr:hypothetical protein NEFER03_1685 [Nematocida sp. LUAm3]KAI5175675.1 hypothetical protein NEFER02_1562 [Nematocida sp. LUAm2]KAI5178581.1 hypothetical protein NEFER01_1717 [Nematocida sp. LUAm1]
MEEVTRAAVLGAGAYGTYLLFRSDMHPIFWALCYDTIRRSVRKRYFFFMRPIVMGLTLFPALTVSLFPSLLFILCVEEIVRYVKRLLVLCDGHPSIHPYFREALEVLLTKSIAYIGLEKGEELSEDVLWYKGYLKMEELFGEILEGGAAALSFSVKLFLFLGLISWFAGMYENPLYYVLRSVPQHTEILSLFENILYQLTTSSLLNMFIVICFSGAIGSPLVISGGVLAGILSVFPMAPLFVYAIPGCLYMWLEGRTYSAIVLLLGGLIHHICMLRMCPFKYLNGSMKSICMATGLRVFGLPGVVIGPFLLSSVIILFQKDRNIEKLSVEKISRAHKTAAEILRKKK